MTALRVAVGQISSESNHFVDFECDLDIFRDTGYVYEGPDVLQLAGRDGEVPGMLAALAQDGGARVVPLLAARGVSSAPLTEECYAYLKERLLQLLDQAGAVDAVMISHHGSMAAAGEDDPEGDVLAAVRERVGPDVPVVITLDLHGNVTRRMVESTSAILGYERYPHDDTFTTGERAARLTLRIARDEVRPVTAHAKLPLIMTGFHASTIAGPFADVMRAAKQLEAEDGVLSTSVFFVGSYLDIPDMGCSALVVADGDADRAEAAANDLAREYWLRRKDFIVERLSVAEAVRRGREVEGGPVLLLDTADAAGGGAAADSADLVRELLALGVEERCLAMVVDPEAAGRCGAAGVGSTVTVELGHRVDPRWGTPITVTGEVVAVSDGRFRYTGGILGGTVASMGPSACLRIGSVEVLVSSRATYDWADEQYCALGMDPAGAKFVGAKNMMNFRVAYGDVMKAFFVLDLPGPTPADMRALPFRRVGRPIYPLDEIAEPATAVTVAGAGVTRRG
jgi:microcystin degradation protein MlrC